MRQSPIMANSEKLLKLLIWRGLYIHKFKTKLQMDFLAASSRLKLFNNIAELVFLSILTDLRHP